MRGQRGKDWNKREDGTEETADKGGRGSNMSSLLLVSLRIGEIMEGTP